MVPERLLVILAVHAVSVLMDSLDLRGLSVIPSKMIVTKQQHRFGSRRVPAFLLLRLRVVLVVLHFFMGVFHFFVVWAKTIDQQDFDRHYSSNNLAIPATDNSV